MEDDKEHRKIRELVEDIRGRARYTLELLTDKAKMLKEKELSMLVKQKMKIHKEDFSIGIFLRLQRFWILVSKV